jgi:glycosyltransferase involved in cell wall biosynthesis
MNKWFSEDNTFVVPNGTIFNNRFNNDKKESNGIKLGYIGIISEQKGIFELINSFRDIHKKYVEFELHIAGSFVDNETEKKVKDFIFCNKLNDSIKFIGNVDEVEKEKFYHSIDILLMPSWHEGHPNVILEALVSKLPVIASDVGAVSESVIENHNGFLIPAKDSTSLTEKVEIFLNNTDSLKIMGDKSYELYKEKFTEEIYINKMINVFKIITEK